MCFLIVAQVSSPCEWTNPVSAMPLWYFVEASHRQELLRLRQVSLGVSWLYTFALKWRVVLIRVPYDSDWCCLGFRSVVLDQHLVRCLKRLNRVTSPCYPPRSILRKPWLLIVFSTISSCDSLVENTIHWSWSFFGYCRLLNREGVPWCWG